MIWVSNWCFCEQYEQPSHKTFRIKKKLAKKMRQNRPIPHWIRMRTDNTIRSISLVLDFMLDLYKINRKYLLLTDVIMSFYLFILGTTQSAGIGAVPSLDSKLFVGPNLFCSILYLFWSNLECLVIVPKTIIQALCFVFSYEEPICTRKLARVLSSHLSWFWIMNLALSFS